MSGYHRLITRKKGGEERSASADRFSRRGSASSRFPCAPPAGTQLRLGGRRVRETALAVFKNGWPKKVAFPVKSFADIRKEHKHPLADIPPKAAAASYSSPASGKETSVPLPKVELGGRGGRLALSAVPGRWVSPRMSTSFMHVIQDTRAAGAEFCWYRPPPLWLFSACGYFSFTTCTVLVLCIFQHMHAAFSVPAASQNALNRLNKNTFMPMLASFVRAETVRLHLPDLLLLCVC